MKLEDKISPINVLSATESIGRNIKINLGYAPGEPQEYGIVVGSLLLTFVAYRIIKKYVK